MWYVAWQKGIGATGKTRVRLGSGVWKVPEWGGRKAAIRCQRRLRQEGRIGAKI